MAKKIAYFGIAIIMFFSIVSLTACKNEEDNNGNEVVVGDFSLTVTVGETKIQKGEAITVTAVFKNLSGKDIPIELTDWQTYSLLLGEKETASPIEIVVLPEQNEWGHISIAVEGRHQMLIAAEEVIQQTFEFVISESATHKVLVGVFFYMGEDYTDFVEIKSKPIKISIL